MKPMSLAASSLIAIALSTVPAFAQEAAASSQTENIAQTTPATASDGAGIEDIVVTATKRETSAQKTPIAINVVGGETLSRVGLVSINAIANLAPSLNFGQANGVFTVITIRGVSSLDATELGDPAVAFNVDGEYINRPLNLAATLFDVARVEVLRGPQGTLYGRNSTAGAVNIITRKPEPGDFSGYITAGAGNYDQMGIQGAVNIPLGDFGAIRASGMYDKHDGYFKADVGPDLENSRVRAGRLHLLLQPTERLKLLVTGEYIRTTSNGPATFGVPIPRGTLPNGSLPTDLLIEPPTRDRTPGGVLDPYNNSTQKAVRGQVDYDFGFARLTDVIAYRDTKFDYFINFAGTPFFLSDFQAHSSYRTFGNELRLASGPDSPFAWQVGYYHFKEDQGPADIPIFQASNPLIQRNYAFPRLRFFYPNVTAKSDAFFGEVTIPLGNGFSATGGIRRTSDRKSRVGTQFLLDNAAFTSSNGATVRYNTTNVGGRVSSKRWTYNAVLNWQATPDSLIYAKYSTGYKAGGFTTVNSYGPEDLDSYEIGTKNRFAGGQIQLNAAAFWYDYQNQQVQTFLLINNIQTASTVNAAASRLYGVETELVAAITPDDRLRVSFDFLHSEYRDFTAALVSIGGTNVAADLSGNRQPYAPKYTIGLGYSHTFHLGDGDLRAEANSAFKSDTFLAATNYRSQRQPAYTSTDFTLTYTPSGGAWDVSAFVRNIENKRQYRLGEFASQFGVDYFRFQFTNPRTYGIRGTVNF